MKMMEGLCSLARLKRFFTNLRSRGEAFRKCFQESAVGCSILISFFWLLIKMTYFSLSPSHLETRSDDEIEKKVELFASVATALAK